MSPVYPKELTTLGDHLRKRRLDLGLLQRQVAQHLGTSAASVWNWETHRSNPKTYLIPRIIEFLGYVPYAPARSFPEMLRTYRQAAGLSQEQLAKLARIDESTLAKWERGDTRPMPETLDRLRRFFARRGMPMPEFGVQICWSQNPAPTRRR